MITIPIITSILNMIYSVVDFASKIACLLTRRKWYRRVFTFRVSSSLPSQGAKPGFGRISASLIELSSFRE